jgi:capsular exopolysaccharide synthesis family protein
VSLPNLVHVLFTRQRRVFLVVLLAVVGGAIALTATLPKQYRATATLFVGENRPISTGANAVQLDEVLSETYAKLLNTQQTAVQVVHALPFHTTTSALSGKVGFTVVNGTRLIEVSATDRKARRAQILANTYARVFVQRQQAAAGDASKARLDELNQRIGQLIVEINSLRSQSTPNALARIEQARNELSAARASFSSTEQNNALQGNNVTVSSRANAPTQPFKPRPKLYVFLGVILGLVIAAGAALLRDVFDKRVRDEDELTSLVRAPILAAVPVERPGADGAAVEAFQLLRTNIQLQDPHRGHRLIMVSSAQPGDGKTTITTRLAEAFARTGADVIAADCDLRKPRLGAYFGLDGDIGVTNVLSGAQSLDDAIVPMTDGPRVLPSGPPPPDPAVLLSLPGFQDLLDAMRQDADYVLVDTPPVTAGADASAVAAGADGVLLIVDLAVARRDVLQAAREQLDNSEARLLGIVLNRVPERRAPYGYYYSRGQADRVTTGNGVKGLRRRTRA